MRRNGLSVPKAVLTAVVLILALAMSPRAVRADEAVPETEPQLISETEPAPDTIDESESASALMSEPAVIPIRNVEIEVTLPLATYSTASFTAKGRLNVKVSWYHCRLDNAAWYTEMPSCAPDDTTPVFEGVFEAGKTYYAKATLKAVEGYSFLTGEEPNASGPSAVTVTKGSLPLGDTLHVTNEISGETVNSTGVIIIAVTPDIMLSLPTLTLTPPKAGQSASAVSAGDCIALTQGEHCYLSDPFWGINTGTAEEPKIEGVYTGTFLPGQTYYMQVTINADEHYIWKKYFNDLMATKVNGGIYAGTMPIPESDASYITGYYRYRGIIAFTPAYTPRIWLEVTSGGSIMVVGPEDSQGDAKLFLLSPGPAFEISNEVPVGSTLLLTAQPDAGYTFKGWYRM